MILTSAAELHITNLLFIWYIYYCHMNDFLGLNTLWDGFLNEFVF